MTVAGEHVFHVSSLGLLSHNQNPSAQPLFGQNGVQTPSKSVFNNGKVRIDFENPNPGQRPGQIHVQYGNEKVLYDPVTGTFPDVPNSVNKVLQSKDGQTAIQKALRMLGEVEL
jgi:filamentous hemagglutinin